MGVVPCTYSRLLGYQTKRDSYGYFVRVRMALVGNRRTDSDSTLTRNLVRAANRPQKTAIE